MSGLAGLRPVILVVLAALLSAAEAAPVNGEVAEAAAKAAGIAWQTGATGLVLVGDSTVQIYRPDEDRRGWGQPLERLLAPGVQLVNRAVGGRSTKTFRAEGRWDPIVAARPVAVLIQFGHNDSHAKDRPESTDAATDYRSNLAAYVADAKAAGIRVVLVTPPPRRFIKPGGVVSPELAPYAAAMRAVAAECGVPCVDLYAGGCALLARLGDEGSAALYCNPGDRSHFSPAGAEAMARIVAEGLLALDPQLRALVRPRGEWPAP